MSRLINPPPSSDVVSKVMKANKGKDTRPELLVRRALRSAGYPGYRLHWKKIPGYPDIAYPGRKVAIFVNGCFWHRCPYCNLPVPKSNVDFWESKFKRNVEHDMKIADTLKSQDWAVFTVWECMINRDVDSAIKNILDYLKSNGQ